MDNAQQPQQQFHRLFPEPKQEVSAAENQKRKKEICFFCAIINFNNKKYELIFILAYSNSRACLNLNVNLE